MYPVVIHTLGCKLNQLESEALADSFAKAGFTLVPPGTALPSPGIIIINTCTVTSKADQKSRRLIRKALRDNPYSCVLVTGCYAQLDSEDIKLIEQEFAPSAGGGESGHRRLFVLGDTDTGKTAGTSKSALLSLPEQLRVTVNSSAVADMSANNLSDMLASWMDGAKGGDPFAYKPEEFAFHSRGYIKIQDGCDNSCNYCRVHLARGPSVSLSPEAALAQLLSFEERSCAELMVTGVNITQYNHSGLDLAGLLDYLLKGSTGIALRLASLEPEQINERLAEALAHPRIRPHFHLSVQSGSETVLCAMGRAYTPQTVEQGAALLRSVKDNPFLACDIITGFPGEGASEFEQTLDLCAQTGFAWIHAFPYSKRPGTKAFSQKGSPQNPVCERDITRRVETLTQLALRNRRNYAQGWLGRELSAVVENGQCPPGHCLTQQCRVVSENYLKLIVKCDEIPPPGSSIRCTPVSLLDGADGEKPDAVAVLSGK
jgi:threonylcarbamoyladenosine tRNA methylthiotransferase MtaB